MSTDDDLEEAGSGLDDIDMDNTSLSTESPPISPYVSQFDLRGPFEGSRSPTPMENLEPAIPLIVNEDPEHQQASVAVEHLPLESIVEESEESEEERDTTSTTSESDAEINVSMHIIPAELGSLPIEILKRILCHIFPVDATVTPWYRCGMRTNGRGISINDDGVTFEPNLDTKFLRINKACNEIGTTILYSHNHFHFAHRADCAKWFLNLIGDHNVRKLKSVTLEMNSGWLFDRRDPNVQPSISEQSYEEDWARSIIKIYSVKARLNYFAAITKDWKDTKRDGYDEQEDRDELDHWRKVVVDRLAKIRGVKRAVIREVGAVWIGRFHAQVVQLMMQQRP